MRTGTEVSRGHLELLSSRPSLCKAAPAPRVSPAAPALPAPAVTAPSCQGFQTDWKTGWWEMRLGLRSPGGPTECSPKGSELRVRKELQPHSINTTSTDLYLLNTHCQLFNERSKSSQPSRQIQSSQSWVPITAVVLGFIHIWFCNLFHFAAYKIYLIV